MKIFRPLAAVFLVSTFALAALAQDSSEIASLRAKAEKGNAIAQYNLGLAYAQGRGIAADPVEAYVWLSLARENGARGRALDGIVAALDKPTLELAQQRTIDRKAALGSGRAPAAKPAVPAVVADTLPAPTAAEPGEDPALARLRKERDAYSAKVGEIAAQMDTLRTERDRLAEQAAELQKNSQALSRGLQEKAQAAEARAADLARTSESLQAELAQARQALATKPAA
ncbi:MAG TPA: SEL1-like repeat protein, partial [Lacunisphaera sp.]|nr:SEL1-like repeat protein [Lacunisphaera sp.]